MFALVAADGDKRRVFGFYDALPDDARLSQAMQSVIEGGRPPFLVSTSRRARRTRDAFSNPSHSKS
jgi:hypothetical protein